MAGGEGFGKVRRGMVRFGVVTNGRRGKESFDVVWLGLERSGAVTNGRYGWVRPGGVLCGADGQRTAGKRVRWVRSGRRREDRSGRVW